ncbi:MAG: hypothetical protein QXT13_07595 [Pyrobaculum sp.]
MTRIFLLILVLTIVTAANELWLPYVLPKFTANDQCMCRCINTATDSAGNVRPVDRSVSYTVQLYATPAYVLRYPGVTNVVYTIHNVSDVQGAWRLNDMLLTNSSIVVRTSESSFIIAYVVDAAPRSGGTLTCRVDVAPVSNSWTLQKYIIFANETWATVVQRYYGSPPTSSTVSLSTSYSVTTHLRGRYVMLCLVYFLTMAQSADITIYMPTAPASGTIYAAKKIDVIRPSRNQFCGFTWGEVGYVYNVTFTYPYNAFVSLAPGRYVVVTRYADFPLAATINDSIYVTKLSNNTTYGTPPTPPKNNAIYDGNNNCAYTLSVRGASIVGIALNRTYDVCAARVPVSTYAFNSSMTSVYITSKPQGAGEYLVCGSVRGDFVEAKPPAVADVDPALWQSDACGLWPHEPKPFPRHLYLAPSGINITILNRPNATRITVHRAGGIVNAFDTQRLQVTGVVAPRDALLIQLNTLTLPVPPLTTFNRTIVNFRQLTQSGTLTINVYTPYAQFALVPYYVVVWQNGTVTATGVLQSTSGSLTLYGATVGAISEYAICNMAGMCSVGNAFLQNNAILVLAPVGMYNVTSGMGVGIRHAGRAPVVNVTAYYTPPDAPLLPLVAPLPPPAPIINNPIPVEVMALVLLPLVAFVGSVTLGRDLIESLVVGALAFVVVSTLFGNTQFIALAIATLVMATVWMMVRR